MINQISTYPQNGLLKRILLKFMPFLIQRLAWLPLKLIFLFFLSMQVRGTKNLKNIKSNFILASNHQCELDPLIIVSALPFLATYLPLFFVSREKEFYRRKPGIRPYIYGGFLFKLMGAFPAYTGLKNYDLALRAHTQIMKSGGSICIFPLGKVHFDDEINDAKGGTAFLAHKSALPILPVRMQGIKSMRFSDFFLRKRKLTIAFGKPFYLKEIVKNSVDPILSDKRNDYRDWTLKIMDKVMKVRE